MQTKKAVFPWGRKTALDGGSFMQKAQQNADDYAQVRQPRMADY